MKSLSLLTIKELKAKMKRGDMVTIETMLNKEYKHTTIMSMFQEQRTMSPKVREAAEKIISLRENL